jgi:hypothetical protein
MPEFLNGSLQKHLAAAFQKASLSIFIDKTARQYNSFSLQTLTEMFSMEKKDVVKFLSKRILNNSLQAHLDTRRDLLVLDTGSTDVNVLQQLSLQYTNHI